MPCLLKKHVNNGTYKYDVNVRIFILTETSNVNINKKYWHEIPYYSIFFEKFLTTVRQNHHEYTFAPRNLPTACAGMILKPFRQVYLGHRNRTNTGAGQTKYLAGSPKHDEQHRAIYII